MSSSQALFGDDSEGEEDELRVNQTFAKAYQSRKQQEELRNYQDNEDDDDSSSASSSEDEDGNLLSPSMDVSILRTIHALRNKDEKIYDPSSRFFPEQNALKVVKEEKRKKPKRFKDVMRELILEQMNQEEKDEDSVAEEVETENPLEYDQEQKALRSAFLESTQEDEDEEADWMMVKKKGPDTKEEDGVEELYQQELQALEKTAGTPLQDPRGEVEDGDKFLLDFLKNKKWIDKEADRDNDSLDEKNGNNGNESDDSMHDLDKADEFESKYNFRFEEAEAAAGTSGADFSVIGYARGGTMNTLRRKDDSRKRKRLERKERKAAERKAKEEQLRRLKNAKREEMEAKLKQIKSVLGQVEERGKAVDEATMLKLMEGDYDPEEFEKMMNEAYGDDFYQQEDAEWKTDTDVRESLLKDEDGNMIVGQDDVEGGLYDNVEDDDEYDYGAEGDAVVDENEDWNEADEYEGEEAFVDDTEHEETETEKKLKEKMMDELYKLDYEDIIAGMPTRFKYRTVEKNDYGLTPEEILFARDSTLKSYVSLKKMAPYREDGEHFVGSRKRRRFREMLKQDLEETMKQQEEDGMEDIDGDNHVDEEGVHTKKKKRRRQKKGKKSKVDGDTPVETESKAKDAIHVEQGEPEHSQEQDVQGKRKRKKKDKKAEKLEEGQTESNAKDDSEMPLKETGENRKVAPAEGTKEEAVVKKSKKAKHRHLNPEKKRRKRKKVSVEGVSASRLASYNL